MDYNQGYLELFLGGVRSGKSSSGLRMYRHYNGLGRFKPVVAIPEEWIRPDDPVFNLSDNRNVNILKVKTDSTIEQLVEELTPYNVIVIDECQFYPHLKAVVLQLLDQKKRIYLCGLDGDINGKPMGETLLLIFYANKTHKMCGDCIRCEESNYPIIQPATMSMLRNSETVTETNDDGVVTKIGGLETFDPVCYYHYRLGNQ